MVCPTHGRNHYNSESAGAVCLWELLVIWVKRLNMGMSFIQLWSGMKIELKVPHMNYACTFDVIGIAPAIWTNNVDSFCNLLYIL